MKYDPSKHHRQTIRLKEFDYSSIGYYFMTSCTKNRICLFGDIIDGEMHLNKLGEIVHQAWIDMPSHYPYVQLDAFVIMPNHFHAVVVLTEGCFDKNNESETSNHKNKIGKPVGAGLKPAPTSDSIHRHGLPEIIRAFKTFSARKINTARNTTGASVWQRNYFEHIIRDEEDLDDIRNYIKMNPYNWSTDKENPFIINERQLTNDMDKRKSDRSND